MSILGKTAIKSSLTPSVLGKISGKFEKISGKFKEKFFSFSFENE